MRRELHCAWRNDDGDERASGAEQGEQRDERRAETTSTRSKTRARDRDYDGINNAGSLTRAPRPLTDEERTHERLAGITDEEARVYQQPGAAAPAQSIRDCRGPLCAIPLSNAPKALRPNQERAAANHA